MCPQTKLQVFANFWPPKKCYNPLPPPVLSRFISARSLFPKLKMKLKGLHFANVADIKIAVTDELKKAPPKKRTFLQLFRNCTTTTQKSVYMQTDLILKKKNRYVFLICFRFKKKLVLKVLDRTVYDGKSPSQWVQMLYPVIRTL